MRILIADDHEAVRKGVRAILEMSGEPHKYFEAQDGKEAVEIAKEHRPDLIILDITMPVMGGFDAARLIKKSMPQVPVLILSMHESAQLIEEAKKIGVQGYVTKTQVGKTLCLAVDSVLRNENFFPEHAFAQVPAVPQE